MCIGADDSPHLQSALQSHQPFNIYIYLINYDLEKFDNVYFKFPVSFKEFAAQEVMSNQHFFF